MDGFDANGRPRRVPGKLPSREGTLIQPHVHGATNWEPPSFSPRTGLFYQAHFENSATVVVEGQFPRAAGINPRATTMGQTNLLNFYNNEDEAYGVVRAYDPATLEAKWEFKMSDITWAGVLTTAGDVAVQRRQGRLLRGARRAHRRVAVEGGARRPDQRRAHELRRGGKQFVTVAAGNALFAYGLR